MREPSEDMRFQAWGLLASVIRHRNLVAVTTLLFVAIGTASVLLRPSFVAELRFVPRGSSAGPTGNIAGIAAQLGVAVGSDGEESVDFYRELVLSRSVLGEIVELPLSSVDGCERMSQPTLLEHFEVDEPTEQAAILETIEVLRGRMSVIADVVTGIVTVRVRMPCREVAEEVAGSIVTRVNRYNLMNRQSQARSERAFLERRMETARDSLILAEDSLEAFLDRNRSYQGPALQFEYARLQRRVDFAQQVYVTIRQAFEQARAEEVRDTPVLTLLDPAEGSARPERELVPWALVSGIAGLLMGILGAISLAGLQTLQSDRPRLWASLWSGDLEGEA